MLDLLFLGAIGAFFVATERLVRLVTLGLI